jgi:hypothetical protein
MRQGRNCSSIRRYALFTEPYFKSMEASRVCHRYILANAFPHAVLLRGPDATSFFQAGSAIRKCNGNAFSRVWEKLLNLTDINNENWWVWYGQFDFT